LFKNIRTYPNFAYYATQLQIICRVNTHKKPEQPFALWLRKKEGQICEIVVIAKSQIKSRICAQFDPAVYMLRSTQ
jgi:hypothetical protein